MKRRAKFMPPLRVEETQGPKRLRYSVEARNALTISALMKLPIAIDGTYDVFGVGAKAITPGRVTIRVGTPIATSVGIEVLKLVLFGAVFAPVGLLALRTAVRFSQRRGTIIEY